MAPRRKVKKMVKRDNVHEGYEEGGANNPTNEAVDSALKNLVIMSEIGGYLDFEELKRCRLVNKVWDELIPIIMRKRAVLRFHPPISTHLDTFSPSLKQWNVDFESQVEFMEKYNIENIKLNLNQSRAVQVKKDISWLMNDFGDQIKHVAIKMDVSNGKDGVLLSKILNHRPGSLTGMELEMNIIGRDYKNIEFPYLETVHVLKIRGVYNIRSDFSNPFNEAALLQFPNLKTLEVHSTFFKEEFAVTFLQALKTLPQFGLENLVFASLQVNQPGFDALKDALEKHAPTLKSLQLGLVDQNYGGYGSIDFVYPHFPKLKKLELRILGLRRDIEYVALQVNDTINWRFPAGQVFYKDDFPVLKDLKVELRVVAQFHQKKVLEAFVPLGTRQNTCHTMKRVHFDVAMNWEDPWVPEFWKRFETVFPNANLTLST